MPDWNRLIGGSPGSVVVKLIFLSLLVGAFLAFFDLTPFALVETLVDWLRGVFDLSFDTVRRIGGWMLAGAVIVVPLWLISRLFARR
jgi:hypothetical protein